MKHLPLAAVTTGLALVAAASTVAAETAACSARSGPTVPAIVELYTSEGCSSCPPADQWLSRLKTDPAVHAFAFHVEYWDYIGWKDRFAHPVLGQRQAQQRDGDRFSASVTPLPGAPARLTAWWAVTEHGHSSRVSAGENSGETLKHDFVVREYRPVAAWNAAGATTLQFTPSVPTDPAHPRQVSLVVVDAGTGKPLQAVRLACS